MSKPEKLTKQIGNQKVTDKKKNITWDRNQALLQKAYVDLIKRLKRCPTQTEVANEVNLSLKTVKLHVKEMKFKPLDSPMRVLTPDVLAFIYNSAKKGSAQSQKLWVQLLEGWSEKIGVEHSGGVRIIKDSIHKKLQDQRNAS
jgi:predicted transcriptional regulator